MVFTQNRLDFEHGQAKVICLSAAENFSITVISFNSRVFCNILNSVVLERVSKSVIPQLGGSVPSSKEVSYSYMKRKTEVIAS